MSGPDPRAAHRARPLMLKGVVGAFVLLGRIALGLLQLVALQFSHHIWDAFPLFLRTRSRSPTGLCGNRAPYLTDLAEHGLLFENDGPHTPLETCD